LRGVEEKNQTLITGEGGGLNKKSSDADCQTLIHIYDHSELFRTITYNQEIISINQQISK